MENKEIHHNRPSQVGGENHELWCENGGSLMPYSGEHAARVRDPGDFQPDSFRRKEIAPGVSIIMGRLKGQQTMTAQSYRFDKERFTAAQAKAWLKEHDVKNISFEKASGTERANTAIRRMAGR